MIKKRDKFSGNFFFISILIFISVVFPGQFSFAVDTPVEEETKEPEAPPKVPKIEE